MQNPGGYGDGSTILMPNGSSTHALHLLFNGDNAGPHSVEQVLARHAKLQQQFPNAEVAGDSWEGFIDAITADGSEKSLQRTTKEEGDTWIYGVQQDLYKTAAFRGIMRARRACVAALGAAVCGGVATKVLTNATRYALKLGEHTWGFNWGYMDQTSYTNDDLAAAIEGRVGGMALIQQGWLEQRAYVDHVIDALAAGAKSGDAGCQWLLPATQAELMALHQPFPVGGDAPAPEDSEWAAIDPSAPVTDLPQWKEISWNSSAGGVASLVEKCTGHNLARADGGSLMQYQYQTLDEDDFWVFMRATLKVQREVAFGKANLTANAPGITSGFWVGKLTKMFRSKPQLHQVPGSISGVDSFLQLIEMPAVLHTASGAPSRVWARFDLSRTEPRINVTLSLFNKTRSRLPEAHWMDFELAVPAAAAPTERSFVADSADGCDSWVVTKLNNSFCATDVSLFGATHVHAVSDTDAALKWGDHSDKITVGVRTLDAAVVALEYKSALPEHVNRTVDDSGLSAASAYVNLCNNFWTTNCEPLLFPHIYFSID
jgi:hypothetical protein